MIVIVCQQQWYKKIMDDSYGGLISITSHVICAYICWVLFNVFEIYRTMSAHESHSQESITP